MRSRLKELIYLRETEQGERVTRKELAEETGINPATLSRYLSPEPFERIDIDTAEKLAEYFGVEWYEIFLTERDRRRPERAS